MSKRNAGRWIGVFTALGIGAFLAVVKWVADPQPSAAKPDTTVKSTVELVQQSAPAPTVSVVFVIDSSPNMFPRFGPNYFDLAKEGIIDFLALPGFPKQPNFQLPDVTWEVGVMQFSRTDAAGYTEGDPSTDGLETSRRAIQWFEPIHISNDLVWEKVVTMVKKIEPSTHHTGTLMEMGIREATAVLGTATGANRHIVLLTTGEYRLPEPCPPGCYVKAGSDCPTTASATNPASCDQDDPCLEGFCNRACHIRFFANRARAVGIAVSTVHLGPEWHNTEGNCPETPYTTSTGEQNYCTTTTKPIPPRDGFTIELTGSKGDVDPDGTPKECLGVSFPGRHARINPFYCFGCEVADFRPGTSRDIAAAVAQWFCDWDQLTPFTLDGDGVHYLCDNCPVTGNSNQRDCDRDGIGDACRCTYPPGCGPGDDLNGNDNVDDDDDGVPDRCDICEGGDDCLVADWTEHLGCPTSGCDPNVDPNECGCDCDHDGVSDACQAAREYAAAGTNCADASSNCKPVPQVCDLPRIAAQPGNASGGYEEDFDDFDVGPFVGAPLNGQSGGWWVPETFRQYVQIVDDPQQEAEKILQINTAPENTPDSFVEGPGLQAPLGECAMSGCSHPLLGPWGVLAVDVELWVGNTTGTSGVGTTSTYDVYIMDPCELDEYKAHRVHLRIVPSPNVGKGELFLQMPPAEAETYQSLRSDFPLGSWVRLTIAINKAVSYRYGEAGCAPAADVRSVMVFACGFLASGRWATVTPYWSEELGELVPFTPRGVQLRFGTDNKGSSTSVLRVRSVVVRPSDRCQWNGPNLACATADACVCGAGDSWSCTWGNSSPIPCLLVP